MAEQEQLDILQRGVKVWNQWREKHPKIRPDLHSANLSGTDLSGADLSWANLSKANLRGTYLRTSDIREANLNDACLSEAYLNAAYLTNVDLSDAELIRTDLSKADLSEANLIRADLIRADLSRANLRGADLSGADIRGADLSGANLSGANLSRTISRDTIFASIDLRETLGLTEIRHLAQSRIELYTVQLPQDGTALHFLRGAGVPEEWIDWYRAEMMHPIQYHSCFISYSSKDDLLARRLHADLQAKGVRCWFAPEDLKIGDKFRSRIDEAIHLQEKLLLLLSEHSIASAWVENEVEAALEKEDQQQREVLFPVRLDDTIMQTSQAWAASLRRTRHIGDFTKWTEPQAYQREFDRLLRDLKQN